MGGRVRGAQGPATMSSVTRRPFCFDRNNRTPAVFGYLTCPAARAREPLLAPIALVRGFFRH